MTTWKKMFINECKAFDQKIAPIRQQLLECQNKEMELMLKEQSIILVNNIFRYIIDNLYKLEAEVGRRNKMDMFVNTLIATIQRNQTDIVKYEDSALKREFMKTLKIARKMCKKILKRENMIVQPDANNLMPSEDFMQTVYKQIRGEMPNAIRKVSYKA